MIQFTAKTPNGCNANVRVEDSTNISINGSYTGFKLSSSGNIISSSGSIVGKNIGVRTFLEEKGLILKQGFKTQVLYLRFLLFHDYFIEKLQKIMEKYIFWPNFGKFGVYQEKKYIFYGLNALHFTGGRELNDIFLDPQSSWGGQS